jgi:uridine kinase
MDVSKGPGERRPAVLDAVAAVVAARRAIRVGVDGVDGVGKTTFADDLAARIGGTGRPVVRAGVDGFHCPRAVRYRRGRRDPDGFYLDSYDYGRMRELLLDPFGPGGDRRYRPRAHDLLTDEPVDEPVRVAAPDAVLVVDGIFLQRPELARCFDLVVWLDAPFQVTFARMGARDGSPSEPTHPLNRRYLGGQRRYLRECSPRDRAGVVVDVTDVDAPVLVRPRAGA